jgi:hypothetical protein
VPVCKEQVEVLERLTQEEGLHHVAGASVQRVLHIADRSVATRNAGVLLDALEKQSLQIFFVFLRFCLICILTKISKLMKVGMRHH